MKTDSIKCNCAHNMLAWTRCEIWFISFNRRTRLRWRGREREKEKRNGNLFQWKNLMKSRSLINCLCAWEHVRTSNFANIISTVNWKLMNVNECECGNGWEKKLRDERKSGNKLYADMQEIWKLPHKYKLRSEVIWAQMLPTLFFTLRIVMFFVFDQV